jgi:hypothetical protein
MLGSNYFKNKIIMVSLKDFKKIKMREVNSAFVTYNYVMIINDSAADRLIFSQVVTTVGFAQKFLNLLQAMT